MKAWEDYLNEEKKKIAEMKGDNIDKAHKHFESALIYADRLKITLAKILAHGANLIQLTNSAENCMSGTELHFDCAISYLNGNSPDSDSDSDMDIELVRE